jgi:threonine/homoserine/homoserine lactone efflux protein
MLAAFLVFSTIALFSGFFSAHLQKSVFTQQLINRLSALVFAGLALRLLLSER